MIKNLQKLFCFALLLCSKTALAQEITASTQQLWNSNIVEIHTAGNKSGSGFVVGDKDGQLYIVTAAHVVDGMTEVTVNFTDPKYNGTAIVQKTNAFYDVAVLSIPSLKRPWRPFHYLTNIAGGDHVYCITVRQGRTILDGRGSAMIRSLDKEMIGSNVGINEGDSGTPLFCERGLAGMIYKQPGAARPALLIKELMDAWGLPWNLPEREVPREIVKDDTPDARQEESLPVQSITDEKTGSLYREIYDNNVQTSTTFKEKGLTTLVIRLKKDYSFNKIKFYCPDRVVDDFPSGSHVYIPGANKKMKLNGIKSPVMERSPFGNWVIFELGKFYRADQVHLVFKIGTDYKEAPLPFTFYEVQVSGPKQPL